MRAASSRFRSINWAHRLGLACAALVLLFAVQFGARANADAADAARATADVIQICSSRAVSFEDTSAAIAALEPDYEPISAGDVARARGERDASSNGAQRGWRAHYGEVLLALEARPPPDRAGQVVDALLIHADNADVLQQMIAALGPHRPPAGGDGVRELLIFTDPADPSLLITMLHHRENAVPPRIVCRLRPTPPPVLEPAQRLAQLVDEMWSACGLQADALDDIEPHIAMLPGRYARVAPRRTGAPTEELARQRREAGVETLETSTWGRLYGDTAVTAELTSQRQNARDSVFVVFRLERAEPLEELITALTLRFGPRDAVNDRPGSPILFHAGAYAPEEPDTRSMSVMEGERGYSVFCPLRTPGNAERPDGVSRESFR